MYKNLPNDIISLNFQLSVVHFLHYLKVQLDNSCTFSIEIAYQAISEKQ